MSFGALPDFNTHLPLESNTATFAEGHSFWKTKNLLNKSNQSSEHLLFVSSVIDIQKVSNKQYKWVLSFPPLIWSHRAFIKPSHLCCTSLTTPYMMLIKVCKGSLLTDGAFLWQTCSEVMVQINKVTQSYWNSWRKCYFLFGVRAAQAVLDSTETQFPFTFESGASEHALYQNTTVNFKNYYSTLKDTLMTFKLWTEVRLLTVLIIICKVTLIV